MNKVEWLRQAMHYRAMDVPVWMWLLGWFGGALPALNEWVNRSKWTAAQTLWQLFWRGVNATPVSKLPALGDIVAKLAVPPMLRPPPAPPPIPSDAPGAK